ncbi:MAG TPA: hypothetical protein VGN81_13930 [Pseudonocardiaceae bacterium]
MNKRLRPTALLVLVRRYARRHGLAMSEEPGRGKGSHRIYVVRDADDNEVGRFAVAGHARELSWPVLRNIENALAHLFGNRWMEDK